MPTPDRTSLRVDVRKAAKPQRQQVTISRADLDWASSQGLLPAGQVSSLWDALASRASANSSKFDLVNLAYYAGASIILIAMAIFMGLVVAQYQAGALVATSLVYGAAFIGLGSHLYFRKGLQVPGGLMFTLAVSVVPVLIFGILSTMGIANFSSSQELMLEVATAVAAVVALTFVRFPFLTMPLFASLWFMSMTITNMVAAAHGSSWFWGDEQLVVSMVFGGLMTAVSFAIDRRTDEDFSFWGYLFGVTSFWLSMTFLGKGGQLGMFIYFAVNVLLMLTSVVLQRRIFLVAGALGASGYLFYEAWEIFQNSMLFPVALSFAGFLVIVAAIGYHKNKEKVDAFIRGLVPDALNRSLPHNR